MKGDPTLKTIDTKLEMFMESQKETNRTVSEAIKVMSKAASKSDAMQVEVDGLNRRMDSSELRMHELESRVAKTETRTKINKNNADHARDIKLMFASAILVSTLAYGWSLVSDKPVAPQLSPEAVIALSELIVKSNKG